MNADLHVRVKIYFGPHLLSEEVCDESQGNVMIITKEWAQPNRCISINDNTQTCSADEKHGECEETTTTTSSSSTVNSSSSSTSSSSTTIFTSTPGTTAHSSSTYTTSPETSTTPDYSSEYTSTPGTTAYSAGPKATDSPFHLRKKA